MNYFCKKSNFMLKIGVLGVGELGKLHIECIKDIDNLDFIGFYDPNFEIATKVAQELCIKSFSTMEELVENVDIVDIVTPTNTHYAYAAFAMKKSKHVFIEKPLTNTIEEAKSLIDIAREANIKAQVGHNERFNAAFTAAKPYINQPMFIESHRLTQYNTKNNNISVVLDLMIYDIDIILSVVNSNIRKITANGVAVISETPDIANARIEFDNGCVANLTASRISLKEMQKMRLFQRNAYVSIDFEKEITEIIRLRNTNSDEITDSNTITIDLGNNKGSKQIFFEKISTISVNTIKAGLESFINAITEKKEPIIPIFNGFQALEVAHKIIEKIESSTVR